MDTYAELYGWGAKVLSKAGIQEGKLDARLLLEHFCSISHGDLLLRGEKTPEREKTMAYKAAIEERAKRIPLAYLTGEQEFMGLSFHVTKEVLVPRQDTELLVETMLPLCEGKRVLDLCTGSGCIGISLAKLGKAQVTATDLSPEALKVARENAFRIGVDVVFLLSDLWEQVTGTFSVIVSNPPYIPTQVIQTLMPEVQKEPHMALDGRDDGLYYYERIIKESPCFLVPGGWLGVEIGYDQKESVKKLFQQAGFTEIHSKQDLAGLNRVVFGRKRGKEDGDV